MKAKLLTSFKKPSFKFLKHPLLIQAVLYAGLWIALFFGLYFLDTQFSKLSVQNHLFFLMTFVVLLGILHWWLLEHLLFLEQALWIKILLTLLTAIVGIFIMKIPIENPNSYYSSLYFPSLHLFALPYFYGLAFKAHLSVPAWRFAPIEIDSLQEYQGEISFTEDTSKGIEWVFGNDFFDFDESGVYSFRTFTPHDVTKYKMEDLFKGLLVFHNYNMQSTQDVPQTISFDDCQWEFYHYSRLFFPKGKKAMNPKKTLAQNGLRFRKLTGAEKEKMQNVSADLDDNFRYATIFIQRIRPSQNELNTYST